MQTCIHGLEYLSIRRWGLGRGIIPRYDANSKEEGFFIKDDHDNAAWDDDVTMSKTIYSSDDNDDYNYDELTETGKSWLASIQRIGRLYLSDDGNGLVWFSLLRVKYRKMRTIDVSKEAQDHQRDQQNWKWNRL